MSFKVTNFSSNGTLAYDFLCVHNINLSPTVFCTVSDMWLMIGRIFAVDSGVSRFSFVYPLGGKPVNSGLQYLS